MQAGSDCSTPRAVRSEGCRNGGCPPPATSVATELASMLLLPGLHADDLHSPASVARMAKGTPLATASERRGWTLSAVGCRRVAACSALNRSYRDRLRRVAPGCVFVLLVGASDVLAARAAARTGFSSRPLCCSRNSTSSRCSSRTKPAPSSTLRGLLSRSHTMPASASRCMDPAVTATYRRARSRLSRPPPVGLTPKGDCLNNGVWGLA